MLEEQMLTLNKNIQEMKKQNDYNEKIKTLETLERVSANSEKDKTLTDNQSIKSKKSVISGQSGKSIVSFNPNMANIFKTKKEAQEDLLKNMAKEKEKRKIAKAAEMSEKVRSIGTVDSVDAMDIMNVNNADDGTHISLGSKRSNKSGNDKKSTDKSKGDSKGDSKDDSKNNKIAKSEKSPPKKKKGLVV